ncbi:hypothetical protein QBC43DRAFT_173599, partial [Cladorrhinum sp. PSN259]
MFELPDAKRVRREDLYDSVSDREDAAGPEHEEAAVEDAELRAKLNARLSSLLSANLKIPPTGGDGDVSMADAGAEARQATTNGGDDERQEAEEAEFDFRLFSTSAPSQKVVLAAKEEEAATGGDVPFARRPISHYIRGELSAEEKEQFQLSAVSAQDVFAAASQRAWGFEVPWRVTKITVFAKKPGQPVVGTAVSAEDKKKKKTRPGKKTRIVLRIREKAKKEEMEKKKAEQKKKQNQAISKEEHLKEKKKRLNREKKLKRRQKEKEKKAASGGGGG